MDTNAAVFRALGDEHRLRILEFIAFGDRSCCASGDGICGCDLKALTGLSQPTISHHMKILTESGLVQAEKCGRWMYYTLADESFIRASDLISAFVRQNALEPLIASS